MTEAAVTAPNASQVSRLSSFWTIVALRAFFLSIALATLGNLIELGTSTSVLILSGALGATTASLLAFTSLRSRGFFTLLALGYVVHQAGFAILESYFSSLTTSIFGTYVIELHVSLALLAFAVGAGASWMFWRYRHWLTAEVVAFIAISVYLLSGHRNYRFDTPAAINSIAWSFNVDELTILVVFGSVLALFLLGYLFVATLPSRPTPRQARGGESKRAEVNWLAWIASILVLGAIFFAIAHEVYSYNVVAAGSRLANGVGEAQASKGLSPLGFHSALGATNQPSGLVRLEGDYRENPFTPMMYLREQALSQYNGHEMVIAEKEYDQDVANVTPQESFTTDPDTELGPRVALRQSIYLLTDHKLAFAVDFPISITPLKNPNPGRFKAAYEAYSMAPAYSIPDLSGAVVGDPRWSEATRAHYLEKHSDPRYQALADSLTEGATDPVEKVNRFVKHINENATYTLVPNHDVAPADDPVAPFLFGDMRGYCVHFAHAMVYLLRASGIPSRIGTGYLTDLSQAKDGHILLRMSDRHAWAEVFIAGTGWIPYDVQPARVESHGESPVDQKLLEDLMASLEPPEEALPKEIAKHEPGMNDRRPFWEALIPSKPVVITLFVLLIILPFGTKSYLRYSWHLPGTAEQRALRWYRAILSRLFDLGIRRAEGETRLEFEARVRATLGEAVLCDTSTINAIRFNGTFPATLHTQDLSDKLRRSGQSIKRLPWWQRMIGIINPASALSFATGGKF